MDWKDRTSGETAKIPLNYDLSMIDNTKHVSDWLKTYNQKYDIRYVVLYHAANKSAPILDEGLLAGNRKRKNFGISESGYVYLASTPKMAEMFGSMGHNDNYSIYEVIVPVGKLLPDKNRLRYTAIEGAIGSKLAQSLVCAGGARVKGDIERWQIKLYQNERGHDEMDKNHISAEHPPDEQGLKNLIEEYKDVKFLNAGMAQSQDDTYVSAEVYLTGDLGKKLDHAQAAQKTMAAFGDNSLDVNVTALERAIEISKSLLHQDPAQESDEPKSTDYSHAYASCVTDDDSNFLDHIIANAADVKEPFVVVKGFVHYGCNVPKLIPMPFIEASELFKVMNSNTIGFWLIHKENEETNKLNIFPYYYDKTGQKDSMYRDANKPAEYHDLHSFITKELQRAQEGLYSAKWSFSGIALLPNQEAIDRGYAALAAVDAALHVAKDNKDLVNMQKRGEKLFTEDELKMVGIETASLWGAEYISHEINHDKGAVEYLCVEHGEMFYTSLSFEKVQEKLQKQHAHNQKQNVNENDSPTLFVDMSDWSMAKDYNGAESFADGSRPLIAETQYADIIICRGNYNPNAVALAVCIGEYYYDGEVATKELAIEIGTKIAEQINSTGKQQFEDGSFRDFFYSLQITDISLQDGISFVERKNAVEALNNHEKENVNMSKYNISARVNPLADQSGRVKAMASITIDNAIAINNLTVVEGNNGNLFVGYPQTKDREDNYKDIVEFLRDEKGKMTKESADLKNAINKLLITMHKNGERATPEVEGEIKEPVMHEIKAFVTPLRDSENNTRGLATVQVGELFKINSVRVNENTKEGSENFGKNFVAMPSRPDKSSESGYRDVVHPVNREYGEHLRDTVLKQYDNQMAWKGHMANKEKAQTAQKENTAPKKTNTTLE